jgi:hypothetical protein
MKRRAFLLGGAGMVTAVKKGFAASEVPLTKQAKVRRNAPFRTEILPLNIETYRLRDIHVDDGGEAWIGANEPDRHIPVVNLKTGKTRRVDMNIGDGQYLDMVLPVGKTIVVCGGAYGKQVFLDRETGKRIEKPLLATNPLIYGGTVAPPYAYLFDCHNGVYRWDTRDYTGVFFPYNGNGQPLVGGRVVASKRAIYGISWWQEGMPVPTPLVKFATETGKHVREFTPPWKEVRTMSPVQVGDRLYMTDMFGGTLMVFDLKTEQWTARYCLPGYGKTWKYTCACTALGPYVFCNTSTFQGVKNQNGTYGFDEQSHHFVNQVIVFDTRDASAYLLPVPALTEKDYATLAYMQTIRGRVYGTCVNSTLQPDGKPEERGPAYLLSFMLEDTAAKSAD